MLEGRGVEGWVDGLFKLFWGWDVGWKGWLKLVDWVWFGLLGEGLIFKKLLIVLWNWVWIWLVWVLINR